MDGLLAIITGLAILAGSCSFLIAYQDSLRRYPRRQARRKAAKAGLVAFVFFAALGSVLAAFLVH